MMLRLNRRFHRLLVMFSFFFCLIAEKIGMNKIVYCMLKLEKVPLQWVVLEICNRQTLSLVSSVNQNLVKRIIIFIFVELRDFRLTSCIEFMKDFVLLLEA